MSESSTPVTLTKESDPPHSDFDSDSGIDKPDDQKSLRESTRSMPWSRPGTRNRPRFGTVAFALLMVASLVTAAATYFFLYAPDKHSDSGAKESAIAAAGAGTVALLSYSPDTLSDDLAGAKTLLTGEFLTYYTEFTEKVVAPAAQENSVDTQAEVVRSAVSDIDENDATVLVFINQTTTSTDKPDPALTASSVRVALTKVDGSWKISAFDPV